MIAKLRLCSLLAVVALAACDKPSEGDCKKAIDNIRALLGTDTLTEDTGQTAAWIRSCVGSAKKSSVRCAMEASTVEALQRCGLVKPEDMKDLAPAPASGSAAPTPAPGSAAPPPTPGSAAPAEPAPPAPGSAAPSAPPPTTP